MFSKVKALTVALLAACAIGAIAASGASAAEFHIAGMGAATGDVTQIGGETEFKIPEGALKCKDVTGDFQLLTAGGAAVETTGPTATITLTEPKHTPVDETLTCTFAGISGSKADMNGCDYVIHAGPPVQTDIVCPAGQQITVTAIVAGVTKCTIHIGPQTGKQSITINNAGGQDIVLKNGLKNVIYSTQTGSGLGACTATTTAQGTNAEFLGEITVQGTAGGVASKLQYA